MIVANTDWKESIPEGEAARFNRLAQELRQLQIRRAQGRPIERGLHAKQHVGVTGELLVRDDLPAELVVGGVFEPKQRWPLYVRYSNGAPVHQPDSVRDVRGVAIKLVGVPGKKVIPGLADKKTQDFLFIPTPTFPFKSPDDFGKLVFAMAGSKALLLPRLVSALGPGGALKLIKGLSKSPVVSSMATQTFYMPAPVRFGKSAGRLALFPKQTGDGGPPQTPSHYRDDLIARCKAGSISYTLKVQLFVDEQQTPIEDPRVDWSSPYHELGEVVVAQQDIESPRGKQIDELVESLSFDPWHAVEELRPLGAVMRARGAAYRESVITRKAAPEPDQLI